MPGSTRPVFTGAQLAAKATASVQPSFRRSRRQDFTRPGCRAGGRLRHLLAALPGWLHARTGGRCRGRPWRVRIVTQSVRSGPVGLGGGRQPN